MPLTSECEAVLSILRDRGVQPLDAMPAAEGRAYFNEVFRTQAEDQEDCARVEDITIPVDDGEIPARIYAPKVDEPLPVMVHFHGGGWVYLGLDTHDGYCRVLANRTGCAVVAVEYRKAPEHPFPIPANDCYGALCWVSDNASNLGLDSSRIGLIGDSAGGNLAAATALVARDRGGPELALQVLTYPAVDATMSAPSIEENASAPLLGRQQMAWFWGHYVPKGTDVRDPCLSPLHADSHNNLPPAFISTAEFDPLRDEGEEYAGKLKKAGVEVDYKQYDGVFHGFMLMAKLIPEGRDLIEAQCEFIRKSLPN